MGLVEGVEIVLQLVGKMGELFVFGTQLGFEVFSTGVRAELLDGVDALLDEFLVELDALDGLVAHFANLVDLIVVERILVALSVRA